MDLLLALTQRARCYLAKQQYDQARQDLDLLLIIDPQNAETEVRFLADVGNTSIF